MRDLHVILLTLPGLHVLNLQVLLLLELVKIIP